MNQVGTLIGFRINFMNGTNKFVGVDKPGKILNSEFYLCLDQYYDTVVADALYVLLNKLVLHAKIGGDPGMDRTS